MSSEAARQRDRPCTQVVYPQHPRDSLRFKRLSRPHLRRSTAPRPIVAGLLPRKGTPPELRKRPFYYEKDVVAFARVLERHPGIVIGQMRRRLNRYDYLTRYLVKIRQYLLSGSIADGWGQTVQVSL